MSRWWALINLRGLRVQILLWTILPLTILLIAFSVTGVQSHQESMRAMTAERDSDLVQLLALDIAALIDRYTASLQVLALGIPDEAALLGASARLDGMALAVIDGEGLLLVSTPGWDAGGVIESFMVEESAVITEVVDHNLLWSIPLRAGDGWLVGSIPLEDVALGKRLRTGYMGHAGALWLVDQDRHVLYTTGAASVKLSDLADVAEALNGAQGVRFIPHPDGEQVVAYAPVPEPGWAVVLSEPWEALTDPLLHFDQLMPFVLTTAAVVSLLTLLFGLRYVVRPLQRLDAQTARIGQGDFDAAAKPTGGVKEIEDLRRTLNQMAQQVQRYQSTLQSYLGAMTHAQEEERARLARELHDETVQTLIALGQRAQMVERAFERDPARASERLSELRTMIGEAVEEVRRLSRALRPLYLEELGLVTALETLAHEHRTDFQVRGATRRLTSEQELALYRIAQEALSNAARHAKAAHVELQLVFSAGEVALQVQDDGVGFVVPEHFADLTRDGHFGLIGMHERAQITGAKLDIASTPGKGSTISVTLAGV